MAMRLEEYLRDLPASGRKALVVQGGGMRGVYSMAALAALDEAGLRSVFDVIVGSSAGAINAAYFLAGQADAAVNLYVEYLSNRNFVNPRRITKIVDIDYLVDTALKRYLPLNVDVVRDSPTLLEFVLTDAETAEAVVVTNRDAELDLYEVIRATAALPSLYNKRVAVGSRLYVDGGTVDSIPLNKALTSEPEFVLAVVTRQPGYRREQHGVAYRVIGRALARGQSAAIKDLIGRRDSTFNSAMEALERQRSDGSRIYGVFPSDEAKLVGRTTFDRSRLLECAAMGRSDMRNALASVI
jgi:predicted patatin/cPLA2 family phospholipase